MFRGLIHFWRINLAVLAAVAVCGAVLAGALLVGDSVRGSLRDLTLDRLGAVDLALAADRFFRAELAEELAADPDFAAGFERIVPAIMLRGNITHGESRSRASQVNVFGVDDRFVDLFRHPTTSSAFQPGQAATELDFSRRDGQVFPSIIVNRSLADELRVGVGEQVLVRFQLGSEIPRDTLLGSRQTTELVGAIRAEVSHIVPDVGLGRFELSPHQIFPLTAFVDLRRLQAALEQPGRVNALLLQRAAGTEADPQPLIDRAVGPGDLGLNVEALGTTGGVLEIRSEEFVLRQTLLDAIESAAAEAGADTLPLQVYLANELRVTDRGVPYSMVLAIDSPQSPSPFGQLLLADGSPSPHLADDEILLNRWAADDLQAVLGDTVRVSYYVVGLDEQLRTEATEFRLAGVVGMRGLAVDPDLTPEYPGIEGVDDIAQWDPPFPVDLSRIRPEDEAYWDEFRGAPKAFVSATTGRRLWSTRYGAETAVRVATEAPDAAPDRGAFEGRLARAIDPVGFGFRFHDVKQAGLDASGGATDFGGLFIAFSVFIIFSAVMIVSLLFRLGIQQRSRQAGLLLAVGYPVRSVRREFLREGMVLAMLGSLLGLAGAVTYARLMILGLTTLWLPAVGSPLLFLYTHPSTLVAGWLLSVLVAATTIWWTTRGLSRVPAARLLAGSVTTMGDRAVSLRRRRAVAVGAAALAVLLLATALVTEAATSPGLAFGIGASLLVSGLSGFSLWCRSGRGRLGAPGAAATLAMASRNSGWNPGRSIISVALVASAAFVIVTVAANTRDPESEQEIITSGAGGFTLLAVSDVPLHHTLEDPDSRFDLGFSDTAEAVLSGVTIEQLRLLPGDDASCLNLYRPERPRILGIPATQIERGGFDFASSLARDYGVEDNPWELLRVDLGPGVVPAIADANSAQWIMNVDLGDEVLMPNERGETVRLRLVGTVRESIFQSELLISEAAFLREFPSQSGFSYFLIDADEETASEVAAALETSLADFGFDTTPTAAKIASYLVVINTYLSTFLMLGGLGLLLGTAGLGIILLRNVIERQGELATLRAFGFRRNFLSRMVLAENAFLLLVGVAIGTLSALAAVAPRFVLGELLLPWRVLLPTLLGVLVVGMLASLAAVLGALRIPLLPALKADR